MFGPVSYTQPAIDVSIAKRMRLRGEAVVSWRSAIVAAVALGGVVWLMAVAFTLLSIWVSRGTKRLITSRGKCSVMESWQPTRGNPFP